MFYFLLTICLLYCIKNKRSFMKTITQLNEEAVKIGLRETYHATIQEALDNARERSTKSNRTVYVFRMESGYMVCVHGVRKIGFTLIKTFSHGK